MEQTKTKPQETFESKLNKQTQSFSFSPPLIEESKWLLRVTSFEATNSVFRITDDKRVFQLPYPVPAHLNSKSAEKTIGELKNLLELRSENDIELDTEQVRKNINFNKKLFFIQSWYFKK